ncbi:hypothetical protein [Bosea vaviloviae]|uniref:Uncharacterized protein n=1 Tax=Bosea vaviloviae TaxID=1526658 RepID=A0A1D7U321_9HYPH|nr:hypothetical protein [Bosea vaviloviae]AOO81742.1 hypothetical protein BHK69_15930 [Bosea vaviloviae]
MKLGWQPRKWLEKKAKRGRKGYPVGTIAFYGPDDRRATKVAVSVVPGPERDPSELRRWFADLGDVRTDETVLREIATFLRGHEVRSVVMADGILGCPHEEGIDYANGGTCPHCPYWAGRDRWAGQLESR